MRCRRRWRQASSRPLVLMFACAAAWGASAPAAAQFDGPLRPHPANPRYFTDDSNEPIYLSGSHTWDNFQDWGGEVADFEWDAYLDLLDDHDHNFIRLWVFEGTSNGDAGTDENINPLPWVRSGPAFDLTTFNEGYFDRLRERVEEAGGRGIYVSVMLFQGWSVRSVAFGLEPWPDHPFRADNNVNGIDPDDDGDGQGREVHENHSRVLAFQQAYVAKVLDTLNDLDNVLYEISNESHAGSTDWQYDMIDFIKEYEASLPKRHPVGMTSYDSGANLDQILFDSPADWISPGGQPGDDYVEDPPPSDGSKVILVDNDHLTDILGSTDEAEYRRWIWKNLTRGNNVIFMDAVQNTFHGAPGSASDPDNPAFPAVRRYLGEARSATRPLDLRTAKPRGRLASTGYCLCTRGVQYLIYQPDPGAAIDVDLAVGDYAYRWLDPASGTTAGSGVLRIETDGLITFTPPITGDVVLDIALDEGPPGQFEDDSDFVTHSLAAQVPPGDTFDAVVTVRNTGDTTWTREGRIKLGAVDDEDPFLEDGQSRRVQLPVGVTVFPGQQHSFTVNLTAPTEAGVYRTDWRMVHEQVAWFGEVALQHIVVGDGGADLPAVDSTTLADKAIAGYQGWYSTPCDGTTLGREWTHWFAGNEPDAGAITVDMWPDTSELHEDELCDTNLTMPDGSTARLYSAANRKTVLRHVAWMARENLDGVFLQRFTNPLDIERHFEFKNQVLDHVRLGAEIYKRAWALTYDLSGHFSGDFVQEIQDDWTFLVDERGILDSSAYLHHDGRPVVTLWGLGFFDRPGTPSQAQELIDWFQSDAAPRYRATVIGGVPAGWRDLSGDSKTDPAWADVYRSYDVLHPWSVGAYSDAPGADDFLDRFILPDLEETSQLGIDYLPTIWPGFSWHNLMGGIPPLNQIPRDGGDLLIEQARNVVDNGLDQVFVAMYDEMDEGTAIFKTARTREDVPIEASFVTLDIDGFNLPNDRYLMITGVLSRILRDRPEPLTEGPDLVTPTVAVSDSSPRFPSGEL